MAVSRIQCPVGRVVNFPNMFGVAKTIKANEFVSGQYLIGNAAGRDTRGESCCHITGGLKFRLKYSFLGFTMARKIAVLNQAAAAGSEGMRLCVSFSALLHM
jgi:hypothetical protein